MKTVRSRHPAVLLTSLLLSGILTIIVFNAIALSATMQKKVMREFRGVSLGMKLEDVHTKLGNPESKTEASEDYKIGGDDTMTVYYDGGAVKTIQLLFAEPKNAPAWTEVIGNAEVKTHDNGSKTARIEVAEEKFWISMYQNKSGTMITITISRS